MQILWIAIATISGLVFGIVSSREGEELKFADCPKAVQKTFQAEARGTKIEIVTRETDGDAGTVYWADVALGGKTYATGVLENGTLTEMNLAGARSRGHGTSPHPDAMPESKEEVVEKPWLFRTGLERVPAGQDW